MLTVFIRHNWKKFNKKDQNHENIVPELLKGLSVKGLSVEGLPEGKSIRIGIHCQEYELTKKEAKISSNYPGKNNRKTMDKFIEISKKGAIVLASYANSEGNITVIGKVNKQSIHLWPYKPYKAKERSDGKSFWIKTLKMDNPKIFKDPLLSVIEPPHSIVVDWSSEEGKAKQNSTIINCKYEKKSLPIELYSLIPAQQEVLCYEYLKEKGLLKYLLLPIGRTLPDIDIYGLDEQENYVYAQVTYKDNDKAKIEVLEEYKNGSCKLYFFSNSEEKRNIGGVEYIPLKLVFDYFKGSSMIREMLNCSK